MCSLTLLNSWKQAAAIWALNEVGAGYNDLFMPNCINSFKVRAFYCCQLASEAYKATNTKEINKSPFLPHKLNFADSAGNVIPYWIKYYEERCPDNPKPPHGEIGTHPSIIRASPCVKLSGARFILTKTCTDKQSINNKNSSRLTQICPVDTNFFALNMRKFVISKDLLSALHFINGARVDLKSATKFKVFEPRNGIFLKLSSL